MGHLTDRCVRARGATLGVLTAAIVLLGSAPGDSADVSFRRGDVNEDGLVDLSDPLRTLSFLFAGTPPALDCEKAADTNDDGRLDINDPVFLLGYLFLGAAEPP